MTEERKLKLSENMLAELKKSKTSIGNKTLRDLLKLEKDEFYEVRNYLVDQGKVAPAMGKGGASIYINIDEPAPEPPTPEEKPTNKEKLLYPKLKSVLEIDWAKDKEFKEDFFVVDTSSQGSRSTGGKWTRPDLVLMAKRWYQHLHIKKLEIVSFEVKPMGYTKDPTGVYETASHAMFAHSSYLMLQLEKGQNSSNVSEVSQLCRRFGIGLIIFQGPSDYDTWETIVEPTRHDPDHHNIEYFLQNQTDHKVKDIISKWMT